MNFRSVKHHSLKYFKVPVRQDKVNIPITKESEIGPETINGAFVGYYLDTTIIFSFKF